MRLITWLWAIPVFAIGVLFAVANRAPVTVRLFPLSDSLLSLPPVPLVAVIFAAFVGGFAVGAGAMWFTAGGVRKRARARRREVKQLKKDVEASSSPNTLPVIRKRAASAK